MYRTSHFDKEIILIFYATPLVFPIPDAEEPSKYFFCLNPFKTHMLSCQKNTKALFNIFLSKKIIYHESDLKSDLLKLYSRLKK